MKLNYKLTFIIFILCATLNGFAQNEKLITVGGIQLDSNKVKLFEKYPEFKYNLNPGGWENLKNNSPLLYKKELWYYTESFYIKRDHLVEGITLTESSIDISRFERKRKVNEEVIIVLPGFKDALVLIPGKDLIYKAN